MMECSFLKNVDHDNTNKFDMKSLLHKCKAMLNHSFSKLIYKR